jgi:hypothetical protein
MGMDDALTWPRASLALKELGFMSLDLSALYTWTGVSWYYGILYK